MQMEKRRWVFDQCSGTCMCQSGHLGQSQAEENRELFSPMSSQLKCREGEYG